MWVKKEQVKSELWERGSLSEITAVTFVGVCSTCIFFFCTVTRVVKKKNEGKVWAEGEQKQEEEEEAWGWQQRSVSWWLLRLGVFLQPVFSYSAGRCRFFCQGGSQVWVREKVGGERGMGWVGAFWFGSSEGFLKTLTLSLSLGPFMIHGKVWLWAPPPPTPHRRKKKLPATVQKSLAVARCSLHSSRRDITPCSEVKMRKHSDWRDRGCHRNACIASPNIFRNSAKVDPW